MKPRSLILIPVLTLSFLVSCSKPAPSPSTTYTVTFNSRDGSYTPDTQTIEVGDQAHKPENDPIKEGFTFGGWYTDEEAIEYKYDFSRPVVTNLTLYANWVDAHKLVTVTFDAKEGLYGDTSRYVCFSVPVGSRLYPYIDIMKDFEPIASNKTFACYSYKDNDAIVDYKDIITSDITLEANYLLGAPYSNLDAISWDYIKQVAVTKNDISEVFIIGATKTVILYNQPHLVRTIGYNHDYTDINHPNETKVGITFEFQNLITKENGEMYDVVWNPEPIEGKPYNRFVNSNLNILLNGDEDHEDCVLKDLPDELTDVMQLVAKKAGKGGSKVYDSEPYTAKLFPLARAEMRNGHIQQEPLDEGIQYEYYEGHDEYTDSIRMKTVVGKKVDEDSKDYWLRSPYCMDYDIYTPEYVFEVSNNGIIYYGDMYDADCGFAPAFSI